MTIIYRILLVLLLTLLIDFLITSKLKTKIFLDNWIAKHIVFKGYYTIMLFGFILTKCKSLKASTMVYERIHSRQWMELTALFLSINIVLLTFRDITLGAFLIGIIGSILSFYIIYVIEWLIRVAINKFKANNTAYHNISFEREAYGNQDNTTYLEKRIPFNFIKYYFKK